MSFIIEDLPDEEPGGFISLQDAWNRALQNVDHAFGRGDQIDQYAEYLRSPHWRTIRAEALRRAEHRCQAPDCPGTSGRLHVHHLTYERLGKELPDDLQVLCSDCHRYEHGL
jgi:hypothetical protein